MGTGRRRWLTTALGGTLGLACGSERTAPDPAPAPHPTPDPEPAPSGAPLTETEAIFEAIISARTATLDGVITRAIEDGAAPDAMFSAALWAALLTRNDGTDIHSMAAVVAAKRVHDDANDALERAAPLFFVAHSNLAWSQRQRVTQRPPSQAGALDTAVEAEDYEAADRAMAAKLEAEGFEACARWARTVGSVPRGDLHAVIWTAHSANLFDLAGPHRGLLLRSLVRYLARSPAIAPPSAPMPTDPSDTTAPAEIAHALTAAPDADLSGLSPTSLFGALAIRCSSLHLADPFSTGSGLHCSTGFDAYQRLYELATEEERPAIVSRAVERLRGPTRAPDVLSLTEGPGDPFALAPTDTVAAYRAALRVCANDRHGFLSRVRAKVARHGGGEHDYKYFGSLLAVAERLATEEAQVRWLATAVAMSVMRAQEPWPHHDAAAAAARSLG